MPEGTIDGVKCPDVRFDGKTWDIKNVTTTNQRTIRKAYADAQKKADRVIFFDKEGTRLEDIKSAVERERGNSLSEEKTPIKAYYLTQGNNLLEL